MVTLVPFCSCSDQYLEREASKSSGVPRKNSMATSSKHSFSIAGDDDSVKEVILPYDCTFAIDKMRSNRSESVAPSADGHWYSSGIRRMAPG